MGDHRLPNRGLSGERDNTGQRGTTRAGREGKIMDRLRGRGSSNVWHHGAGLESNAALDPGVWYDAVCQEGGRLLAAGPREEEKEKASENRQRARERQKRRTRLRLHPR